MPLHDQADNEEVVSLREAREAAQLRDQQRLMRLLESEEALARELEKARKAHKAADYKQQALRVQESAQAMVEARLSARQGEQDDAIAALLNELKRHASEVRNALGENSWLALRDTPLPPRLEEPDVLERQHVESVVDSLAALTAASGQAQKLSLSVADASGQVAERDIIRLGDFVAFTPQALLQPGNDPDHLALQSDTPAEVKEWLAPFAAGESRTMAVDPTQGSVFAALQQRPTLMERFHQGGYVGYIVVALGGIGLLVALVQYLYLVGVSMKVRRQRRQPGTLMADNPLGRVLLRFAGLDKHLAPEALEARLDEAVLAELPRIERGQPLVKLLAAIAPLLGLLGTVTGMIVTFQSITVFGTGDPQLMAGGISQALVTTVLGLVTAVPLLFAQTALSSRSRTLTQVIEGQASAALADYLDSNETLVNTEADHVRSAALV
ncbi:MotA/TolQ/ExbB proton channel family protein [Halomonas llamarensis]|uniref:MotA/TolQ/ExbB proton channel family protein n=1 Tax=Halomonas llamarensis TaxID=2945104 RepID=A0ABT0SM10_9GAMM|nr:MotA/TolQ/ExbB proton channel family protein [Halomonas llamarensis]MCL7928816.1 MotA/TolQ/ExbB proton channel family protein [Halomonas llamarensis]